MMKKNGFTLAEVLITLAIIGVVATMTLPALMTNVGEQQYKTGLKKGINTLTEAAQMNMAIDGYDYGSLGSTSTTDEESVSLYALLAKRTNINYETSGESKLVSQQGSASDTPDGNYAVFLRDGSAILFDPTNTVGGDAITIENDNLPHGICIIYDTNGSKGPNVLSNCSGEALGAATDDDKDCTKANRVIKDQFGVRLRGSVVVPNGAAARWAFEN